MCVLKTSSGQKQKRMPIIRRRRQSVNYLTRLQGVKSIHKSSTWVPAGAELTICLFTVISTPPPVDQRCRLIVSIQRFPLLKLIKYKYFIFLYVHPFCVQESVCERVNVVDFQIEFVNKYLSSRIYDRRHKLLFSNFFPVWCTLRII